MGTKDSLRLQFAGVDFLPPERFLDDPASVRRLLEDVDSGTFDPAQLPSPKLPIRQVFADDQGNQYLVLPTAGDAPVALPYITGATPATIGQSGFIPATALANSRGHLPGAGGSPDPIALMGGLTTAFAESVAKGESLNAVLVGQFQSQLTGLALNQIPEEFRGIAGQAVNAALNNADSLLGGLFGSGAAAPAPGAIPGIDSILSERPEYGFPGGLAGNAIDGVASNLVGMGLSALTDDWKVDDSSSTLEQVAHKYGMQAMDKIKDYITGQAPFLLKDAVSGQLSTAMGNASDRFGNSLTEFGKQLDLFFNGMNAGAVLAAAHVGSKDDKADAVSSGLATVLVQGKPIARIKDLLVPSRKIILEGATKVLAGGLPVARVTSVTAVPSGLSNGATTVLIGGPSVRIAHPVVPSTPPVSLSDAVGAATSAGQAAVDRPKEQQRDISADAKNDDIVAQTGSAADAGGLEDISYLTDTQMTDEVVDNPKESGAEAKEPASLEMARLNKAKYQDKNPSIPQGWTMVSKHVDEGFYGGFDASVYKSDDGRVALVFEGTDFSDLPGDWFTNVDQAMGGVPKAYQEAKALAIKLKAEYGDKLVITGHSAGGGMANYAGLYTGSRAYCYDAAGLGPGTRLDLWYHGKLTEENKALINHYNLDGEVLSSIVNKASIAYRVVPVIGPVVAELATMEQMGNIHTVPNLYGTFDLEQRFNDHGIGRIVDALEKNPVQSPS